MIAKLTSSERQNALILAAIVALAGMAMAALGRSDVLGVHGLFVMLFAGVVLFLVMSSFYDPEPAEDRETSYYDDPIKAGIVLVIFMHLGREPFPIRFVAMLNLAWVALLCLGIAADAGLLTWVDPSVP